MCSQNCRTPEDPAGRWEAMGWELALQVTWGPWGGPDGGQGVWSRDSGHLARDAVVCNSASGGAEKRLASGCIWGILHFHVIYIKQNPKAEAETCVSSDMGAIEAHEPVDAT